jgi:hypothetical protein
MHGLWRTVKRRLPNTSHTHQSVKPEKLTQQTDGRNRQGTQVLVNQQEETQTRAQRVIIRRRKDVRVPYL